jgi:ABC-type sugar transport system substrate-binding protein
VRRILASVAIGVMVAAGVTAASAAPAAAHPPSCSDIGFSQSSYGQAWATGCSHTGSDTAHELRLVGNCRFTPFSAYSPWVYGSFTNGSFTTGSCRWGVHAAGFGQR